MVDDILVVYYSWQGNTRKIAKYIAQATGGRVFEVEPVMPYTTNYSAAVAQARKEIKENFRPELKTMPEITSCSTVFLGTPIWCGTMAPPLASFIDNSDLSGKTVIPFYTHGGGGGGRFERDVTNMCAGSTVTRSFSTYNSGGSVAHEQIKLWLQNIGVL